MISLKNGILVKRMVVFPVCSQLVQILSMMVAE